MDKKELKKASGDVFFEASRMEDNSYIRVNWVGIQSLETIMMGSGQLLSMLQKKPCAAILNSNKELIGPWDDGALYLGSTWALKAKFLGVTRWAHVMSPGIYGQRSFQKFNQLAEPYFSIEAFDSEEAAAAELRN